MKSAALMSPLVTFAAWFSLSAALADTVKPIRHLRFGVDVGLSTIQDETNYNGHVSNGSHVKATGFIDADVLAVAKDGGLVFSVSESADDRKAPATRVAVMDQGQLAYAPTDGPNLNDEELVLLAMLARSFVANHDLSAGYEWRNSHKAALSSESMTVHVVSLEGDSRVKLEVDRVVKVSGAQPYDMTAHGKVLYDYKRSVPISAGIQQRTHYNDMTNRTTTDMSFDYRLAEDSFATNH